MSSDTDTVRADVGIIGGSGLYKLDALTEVREARVLTPYGDPSDPFVVGELAGLTVAFLPRHGRNHRLAPSQVPARANIWAFKSIGVRQIISVSAVGSLREDYAPGDLVTPDQIVDRTRGSRDSTFFDDHIVVHVPFAAPYCERLRPALADAARRSTAAKIHGAGTYCCMEGPQFSTRAESNLYRSWGLDIIGMTALPEAKLAREAELCYAGLALVTDYDCWRVAEGYEDVSADAVAEVMRRNGAAAKATLVALLESAQPDVECACHSALANAIITPPDTIPSPIRARNKLLVGKYLPASPSIPRPIADTQPV
ncbi:S-methyl-5'-thioadenosine phosphorylase [Actinomadura adrarensis]|uniref:S-methyl-5'-thioadenosine phosphorylase n=1 Tax=Actinomadura adrarensis TaxID=1819600 RepID=A0ABW3CSI6_9ACTN